MLKSASYIFSAYSFILSNSNDAILEVGHQIKEGNPIPSFDEEILIELCSNVQTIFEKEDNVLQIDGDLIIVGDIHGSLHDLLRILKFIQENKSKVLFLGDYVDRGNFSLECITLLFALKVLYPDQYYLIRGNHEFDSMCSHYGFKNEIINYHNPKKLNKLIKNNINLDSLLIKNLSPENEEAKIVQCEDYFTNHNDADCYKYSEILYNSFISAFNYLPIAAIVNNKNLCIHGGLSPRFENINQIRNEICRPISNFEENKLLTDIIWSDPSVNFPYLYGENPRERGFLFNANAVSIFLEKNSLKRIIRGHQCIKGGIASYFNEKCVTVFSSSSYSKEMGNNSGILRLLQKNDKIEYIIFSPLKRLQKIDAVYYKVQNEKIKLNMCFSIIHPKLTLHASMRMKTIQRYIKHGSNINSSRVPNLLFTTNSRKSIVTYK